jgi:hypothetical protein
MFGLTNRFWRLSPISSLVELVVIIIEIIRTTKTAFDAAGSAWRAGAAPNFSLVKFNGGKALATDRMIGRAAETVLRHRQSGIACSFYSAKEKCGS